MTSEVSTNVAEGSLLSRITRYTTKGPSIVVDRFAATPAGKLTVDTQGEYMAFVDLVVLMRMGALMEVTPDLQERLLDGDAQRGLMRDIGNLGYTDFEQVMEILKNNRHQLLDKKEYTIWVEGHQATGEKSTATLAGKETAFSFHEAIQQHVNSLGPDAAKYWHYVKDTNTWTMWGCRAFDNEVDARKAFG